MTTKESFSDQFGGLLSGTLDMFQFAEVKEEGLGGGGPATETDVDIIYKAERKIEEFNRRGKEVVDAAREDVRALARHYQQTQLSTARSTGLPTTEEHQAQMASAQQALLAGLKTNKQMEQALYRYQADLSRLQLENREEEEEEVEVAELNSEVLRVKLYRDMGFTPVEEDGIISKVLVRSQTSQDARTVQLDTHSSSFFWANFLWDSLSA